MDPKIDFPVIKPDVNKDEDNDRRTAGFFSRLFGGAGAGGTLAGGAVDIGGAAAGGGLLATKAGLIALLLAGSTVAAGIGLIGYRVFGPGQDSTDNNYALFAPKPKPAATGDGVAPGSKDGTSPSLNMLNQGNADGSAKSGADAGVKDATAADASAASTAANTPNTAMSDSGPAAPKTIAAAKLPPLAGFGSGGGMPTGGSSASAGGPSKFDASSGKTGTLGGSGGKSAAGARTASASARPGHSNGALGQAFGVLGNQAGGRAGSSFSAGRTYDGSATTGASAVGPSAGAPSIGGTGDGTGQTAAKSTPNAAISSSKIQAPPTPAATNVTPWQGDINAARALIGIAMILILAKRKLANSIAAGNFSAPVVARIIDGIVFALGLAIIALGARISGQQYGQVAQGQILMAAGAGVMLSCARGLFFAEAEGATDPATTGSNNASQFKSTSPLSDPSSAYILVGGGMAVLSLIGSMLKPPTTYPSTEFNNGLAPGQGWFSMGRMPSQDSPIRRLS